MESIRFILIVSLAMVTMKLWMTWEETYNPQVTTDSVAVEQAASDAGSSNEVPVVMEEESATREAAQLQAIPGETRDTESFVEIVTDTFRIKINPVGAGIQHAALRKFPTSIETPGDPFVLMDERPGETYITQSGLLSRETAPTHEAVYQSAATTYSLEPGEQTLTVPFEWSGNGITVNKIYEFERGSHVVKVRYHISNSSPEAWNGRSYTQFKRTNPSDGGMRLLYTYTGAVISSEENRYEKIAFDDIDDGTLERNVVNGWIAMIQHYFLTALIPVDKQASYSYYTRSFGSNVYAAGAITPAIEILPGEQNEIVEQIYIGPKDQDRMAQLADGLDLTVDYGKLWFLAKPLFWALSEIHEITGNWGWSIILVTVFLKILFYKLSAAGYRSMANMRRVQPRLVSLKERYKDDRAKMNQAMMQIYKEEKINPLGGCFPILIQIPVFIALYWVLLESVELRQAEFIFWLQDLSTPDPYWVLPVIMGITMFVQQKLNPAPIDPIQAKVMMVLPFVFTVFFGFFPSGLVLYWVANNTLSIVQQWLIMRALGKAGTGNRSK